MKSYTFEPSDLLFVRDARPIDTVGGHGARWPDSPLIFDAIHAALHRAFPEKQEPWEHAHRTGVSKKRDYSETNPRNQRFGGLATAGIFPVENGKWFFPRPADWREDDAGGCGALRPMPIAGRSNLPTPLTHGLASPCKPSKIEPKLWWSREAFASYLQTTKPADSETKAPAALYDSEWQTGIGIDAERQTQGRPTHRRPSRRRRHPPVHGQGTPDTPSHPPSPGRPRIPLPQKSETSAPNPNTSAPCDKNNAFLSNEPASHPKSQPPSPATGHHPAAP
jgi:hypothetical protein